MNKSNLPQQGKHLFPRNKSIIIEVIHFKAVSYPLLHVSSEQDAEAFHPRLEPQRPLPPCGAAFPGHPHSLEDSFFRYQVEGIVHHVSERALIYSLLKKKVLTSEVSDTLRTPTS